MDGVIYWTRLFFLAFILVRINFRVWSKNAELVISSYVFNEHFQKTHLLQFKTSSLNVSSAHVQSFSSLTQCKYSLTLSNRMVHQIPSTMRGCFVSRKSGKASSLAIFKCIEWPLCWFPEHFSWSHFHTWCQSSVCWGSHSSSAAGGHRSWGPRGTRTRWGARGAAGWGEWSRGAETPPHCWGGARVWTGEGRAQSEGRHSCKA